ncbi:anhydro-N-acetylmuramic acid kinase [Aestuariibacter salexigens]|uniref:anhydro-N-acetylmuramic acid kinase n=1 Tax=Aestuariibacter salexigens TaxID=226010 RepID=UPI00055900EC|nr:anhydro-N-acetylmuramic acid kinase [Aestuariibacter salexigens]
MYYIGLMSGTSLDGIDVALARFSGDTSELEDYVSKPFSPALRNTLLQLCATSDDEIEQMGRAQGQLAAEYAAVIQHLLEKNQINAREVKAIGCHGQTVRHRPDIDMPFTLQLVDASRLAVLTGIDVVSDFRSKDMALGGQGAPLAPGFHHAFFARHVAQQDVVIVNIGGIANLTVLPHRSNTDVLGFDSGPGNGLMDAWMQNYCAQDYDKDGVFAASGRINQMLLDACLQDDYFAKPMPKSTGREYFNLDWVRHRIERLQTTPEHQDVLATLTELTAVTIADAIKHTSASSKVFICGGGAYNTYLMQRLSQHLDQQVQSTAELGLSPDAVEAMAFAWLAHAHIERLAGNIPAVTGASRQAVLGSLTPWQ